MRQYKRVKVASGSIKPARWDFVLTFIGLKEESLAARANKRLMAGVDSSPMSKKIVGRVSSKKFNAMMSKALAAYNEDHKEKIFNE